MNKFKTIQTIHGISTRQGGVSQGVFGEMNTSFFGMDDKMAVFENIKRSIDMVGSDAKIIIASQQIHSNHIVLIDENTDFDAFKRIDVSGSVLDGYELLVSLETDGLFTSREDVILMTFYADCVPLLFFDPVLKLVGSVHSGWKGTAHLIGEDAIKLMEHLGSDVRNIGVGIGHCAGLCCYEVDEPVFMAFKENFSSDELAEFLITKDYGKYQLDLKKANFLSLFRMGVLKSHIEVNLDCTICDADKYHSHRRTGYPRGTMSAFIGLK